MNMMLWCLFKCVPPLNRGVFWIQSKGLWVLAVCIYNFGACPSPIKIGKNDAILTVHFPLKRRQETCHEGPMGLCGNGLINHLLGQFGPPRLQHTSTRSVVASREIPRQVRLSQAFTAAAATEGIMWFVKELQKVCGKKSKNLLGRQSF